ncbi:MAG: hypothetical protein K2Y37_06570 [Pirellulales bacterium]|nr:hypothetical protein [Pirellulales bacterium]
MTRRHLISEDELRAAGALDVPPEWRKSLSAGCKPREQMLFADDDLYPEAQPSMAAAADECDADESEDGDEAADDEE